MKQLIHAELRVADDQAWGPCGLLTQPGDTVAMADRIQEVLTDPALYADLARNARERVRSTFQLHDVTATYNTIYRVLGGLPARSEALAASLLDGAHGTDGAASGWVVDVQRHVSGASRVASS